MRGQKVQLLFSDANGKIYNLPDLEATGMKGGYFFRLRANELIKLPPGSELFLLPDRIPVGYDKMTKKYVSLASDPFSKKNKRCFAVAAFVSPGYAVTYNSSYIELGRPCMLPLFSYAAVSFYKGEFYVASVRVDRGLHHDLRYMDINRVRKNAKRLRKEFQRNRLVRHLERCALVYGCPTAKNLFLQRYEAPLPTSPYCNALCMGCISYQPRKKCPVTQPRIDFVPTAEEVAEVALCHIANREEGVVSFGQGCEGEPLLVGDVLEKAIKLIRKKTSKGVININTNASIPRVINRLFDSGLDSMRVSLNSADEKYYTRYYKPRGYRFKDVIQSIEIAKGKNGFVSINYLVMPGFTDSRGEINTFRKFIEKHRVDMIQWRNLNYDPLRYFNDIKFKVDRPEILGIRELIARLKKDFSHIMMGYFNPSRQRMKDGRR